MNRKHLIIALLMVFNLPLIGQVGEGRIKYKVTANWTKMIASLDYMSKQQVERMQYVWGKRSEYSYDAELYFTPSESKYEEIDTDDSPGWSSRKVEHYIKVNRETEQLRIVETLIGKEYIVQDSLPKIHWKILNDMREIAGHVCMNASYRDPVRGHQLIAWFALDMPIGIGPLRYYGLPGAILELDMNNGATVISATSIESLKITDQLDDPKRLKGKKIDLETYNRIILKEIESARKNQSNPFNQIKY